MVRDGLLGLSVLMAIMLGPETLCNVLHIGEYPPEQSAPTAIVASIETAELIAPTFQQTEEEPVTNPSPLSDEEWTALVEACAENGIEPSLVLGMIWVESRFQPDAVSHTGCYGYCQINPKWHPADLSPTENIRYGIRYLKSCIDRYDNLEAGLTAYNAGHDTGRRGYANAVLEAAKEWE